MALKIKDVDMDQCVAQEQFKTYLGIMNETTITQPTDRRICGMLISGPNVKVVDATVPLQFSPFYDINDPSVYQFLRNIAEAN
jgi:hypothetical protein